MNDTITRPIIAPITISASGTIIASNPSQYIYIRQIVLVANGGANTITLQKNNGSVATDLSVIPLQSNGSFVIENTSADYPFLFDIEPGSSFDIDLSAATAVSGHVVYGFRK